MCSRASPSGYDRGRQDSLLGHPKKQPWPAKPLPLPPSRMRPPIAPPRAGSFPSPSSSWACSRTAGTASGTARAPTSGAAPSRRERSPSARGSGAASRRSSRTKGDRVQAGAALLVLEPGDLEAQRLMAQGAARAGAGEPRQARSGARVPRRSTRRRRARRPRWRRSRRRRRARAPRRSRGRTRASSRRRSRSTRRSSTTIARRSSSTRRRSPSSQLDDADAALKGAVAQRDAAAQVLDELKNGSRREDIAQAQARAAEAQREREARPRGIARRGHQGRAGRRWTRRKGKLDQIATMIDELTIRAPRAARVESLDLRPGDILAPNATAATLLEDDQLYVRIYVPETQIGHIHVGPGGARQRRLVPEPDASRASSSTSTTSASTRRATCRPPTSAPTRSSRRASACAKGADELRAGMAAFIHVPK